MLRQAPLAAILVVVLPPSSALAEAVDTARIRNAFDAVTARRNQYERDHGRFAEVNGIKMHYLEWGQSDGVPLVWAHGSASTAYEIRGVAPRLARAGYRVLSVDYRGHGLTRVTDFEFSIQHVADDLVALLDHLRIPAAVFGGASKGGIRRRRRIRPLPRPRRVLGVSSGIRPHDGLARDLLRGHEPTQHPAGCGEWPRVDDSHSPLQSVFTAGSSRNGMTVDANAGSLKIV